MTDSATFPRGSTWDTTDPDNPQPQVYPICGGCKEAYVYTRCLNFMTGKYLWAWTRPAKVPRGCRHKEAAEIESVGGQGVTQNEH